MILSYLFCLTAGITLISLSLSDDGALDSEGGPMSILFSTLFWSFGLAGFGLSGVLLSIFVVESSWLPINLIALIMGLAMGIGATKTLAILGRREADNLMHSDDIIGMVGRITLTVEAEVPVQEERIKQVTQQLQADVIAPAEPECETMIAAAKGEAATIIEQGRSQAEGLQELVGSLKSSGDDAKRIFILQKLEPILTILRDTVQPIEVEEVSLIG